MTSAHSFGSIWSERTGKRRRAAVALLMICALVLAACAPAGDISHGGSKKNRRFPGAVEPREDKIRVACVGDSITFGAGVEDQERNSYPARLQKLLGEEYQVLNYGLPGKTLQREGGDPYTRCLFYEMSMEAQPHFVVIMLGTNDAMQSNWDGDRYEKQLGEMVETYRSLESSPGVILAIPPAAYCLEGKSRSLYGISPERISGELADIIRKVAAEKGVEALDLNTPTQGHREWVPDGIHPNAKGNQVMAEIVAKAILP